MEIFQTLENNMVAMGFEPNQQQNNNRKLSPIQIIVFTILAIDVVSLSVFYFYEAKGLEEHANLIFGLIVDIGTCICFTNIILRNDDIFNMIETVTQELSDSESII